MAVDKIDQSEAKSTAKSQVPAPAATAKPEENSEINDEVASGDDDDDGYSDESFAENTIPSPKAAKPQD